jgi:hypothetical protein
MAEKCNETEPPAVEKPLPKLYFNMFVAGIIRGRRDFEAINCDLLYFTLLMKMNQYAKEVYFLRKAKTSEVDVKAVYAHLMIIRRFLIQFYELPEPNWKLLQNELEDPLAELDSLPLEEDPFGDKKTLDSLVSDLASEEAKSPDRAPLQVTPSYSPDEIASL